MKITAGILLAAVLIAAGGAARAEGLQDSVDQAADIIKRFKEMPEKSIPEKVSVMPAGWRL
jgi:hypothetical protein